MGAATLLELDQLVEIRILGQAALERPLVSVEQGRHVLHLETRGAERGRELVGLVGAQSSWAMTAASGSGGSLVPRFPVPVVPGHVLDLGGEDALEVQRRAHALDDLGQLEAAIGADAHRGQRGHRGTAQGHPPMAWVLSGPRGVAGERSRGNRLENAR
jgi:hypothetical protein